MADDTIFALSSGSLPAGVAVIRAAGPQVRIGLDTIVGRVPAPRRLTMAAVRGASGDILDRGMVAFFPAPHSFSGDDTMELHLHGGPAVVASVLATLGALTGFRLAQAGEFTRRAFHNGKLDLVQVEGLADLIAAETEAQQRQALRQAGGSASAVYGGWREEIIRARAMIEAELDFSDEEDVPDAASDRIWDTLAVLAKEIVNHVGDQSGERVRDGLEFVVVGAPNSGKSSLVNALARRDVAIVADEAGTTRDLIEVHMNLGGVAVKLVDTAGLREAAQGGVEQEGIRRALRRAESADLVLWLKDLGNQDKSLGVAPVGSIAVGTKIDLISDDDEKSAEFSEFDAVISVQTGRGLAQLIDLLTLRARELAGVTGSALVTRQRQRDALRDCAEEIQTAVSQNRQPLEIRSEALRRAGVAIGRITGAVDVEDLLDVVFADFCVGK